MREHFDDNELYPVKSQRDTELTLGPTMLLGFFFGLVLLCGLCFGVGYLIGGHGWHSSPTSQQAAAKTVTAASGSQSKPTPAPPAVTHPRPAANLPSSTNSETETTTDSQNAPSAFAGSTQSASYDVQQVRPAQPTSSAPVTSRSASGIAPTLMVQIAAVSHQEDADVLVGALRKHGYSVTANRDITDRLIHVRIGPFISRNDAESTRQKLHNDGYNAIVQP